MRTRNPHPGMATYRTTASKALAQSAAPDCGCTDPDRIGNGRLTMVFVGHTRVRNCKGCMIELDMRKNGR